MDHAPDTLVLPTLPDVVRIAPNDEVAVALRALEAGERIDVAGAVLTVAEPIARGHKVAVRSIGAGAPVHRYGWPIGTATCDIGMGDHVHSHNLVTNLRAEEPYDYAPIAPRPQRAPGDWRFRGYRRADGSVGTRNEIWVIPTVGSGRPRAIGSRWMMWSLSRIRWAARNWAMTSTARRGCWRRWRAAPMRAACC